VGDLADSILEPSFPILPAGAAKPVEFDAGEDRSLTRSESGAWNIQRIPGQRALRPVAFPRRGRFDSLLVEPGPPAVKIGADIVLLYNGANHPTHGDPSARQLWKFRLVRNLYDRGFAAENVRRMFLCIDMMMELPPALHYQFEQDLALARQSNASLPERIFDAFGHCFFHRNT